VGPIDTAPIDQDVIVTDGGEPYELHSLFKLTAAGWVSSGKGYAACRPAVETTQRNGDSPPLSAAELRPRRRQVLPKDRPPWQATMASASGPSIPACHRGPCP
jgi:hypothetical protein